MRERLANKPPSKKPEKKKHKLAIIKNKLAQLIRMGCPLPCLFGIQHHEQEHKQQQPKSNQLAS
jgi:hypothetical protein